MADRQDKPLNAIPAWYASMYVAMTATAREHGYALALHGSMGRDLDVIAIPWVETCGDAETLVRALERKYGWYGVEGTTPTTKPHGRTAWVIVLGDGFYVDLSVMPRQADTEARKGGEG